VVIAPAERTACEGDPIVRAESELDPDPLVLRLAMGLLLSLLLPLFALAFLASITLAIVLLPLVLPYAFIRRPRGALPHEARAAPSHPGGRRDIPRA
jgi:hypothetical protein